MSFVKVIPCLDVKEGRVVKGVQFEGHVVVGEILELAGRLHPTPAVAGAAAVAVAIGGAASSVPVAGDLDEGCSGIDARDGMHAAIEVVDFFVLACFFDHAYQ